MKKYIKKVLVIGNHGVGKTSLVTRYVENKFSDAYLTTIGVNIMKKIVSLKKDNLMMEVALMLWDIEGATKSQAIPAHYAKGANGYIVVIDGTREETLEDLSIHLDYIGDDPFVLAINKSDLSFSVELDQNEILRNYPNCNGIFNTSAKENLNVEKLFVTIANATI
jgi:small GTP-binding protein